MVGRYDNSPNINLEEVVSLEMDAFRSGKADIKLQPELYTEWFKIIFEKFYEHINTASHESHRK